jgi:hypothetical protein
MSATEIPPGLTIDEYSEAVERGGNGGVPYPAADTSATTATSRRFIVGIFGGTKQHGRWRLSRRLDILALFGGVSLDLGAAEPEAQRSVITAVAIVGGVELIAPPSLPIQLSGVAILGGKSDERSPGPLLPGAPLVRVRVFALLGGVKIRERTPSHHG